MIVGSVIYQTYSMENRKRALVSGHHCDRLCGSGSSLTMVALCFVRSRK